MPACMSVRARVRLSWKDMERRRPMLEKARAAAEEEEARVAGLEEDARRAQSVKIAPTL